MSYLTQYIMYVRNTAHDPLPTAMFDEDWEPIGPEMRRRLHMAGFIEYVGTDAIRLTQEAKDVLDYVLPRQGKPNG